MSSYPMIITPDPVKPFYDRQMSSLIQYDWPSQLGKKAKGLKCPLMYKKDGNMWLLYIERFFTDMDMFCYQLQERQVYLLGSYSTLLYKVHSEPFVLHIEEFKGHFTYYHCQVFSYENKLLMKCLSIQTGQRCPQLCVSHDIPLQYERLHQ